MRDQDLKTVAALAILAIVALILMVHSTGALAWTLKKLEDQTDMLDSLTMENRILHDALGRLTRLFARASTPNEDIA